MSRVEQCPTCGGKAKVKEKEGQKILTAVQDEEAFKKIGQLKKAMNTYKLKVEKLEEELKLLQSEHNN